MQPTHIQYIIDHYSTQLQIRLMEEGVNLLTDQAIDVLMACDPSEGSKLVDWLVKTYCSKGFRWEDVEAGVESKLAEVLGLYKTNFHQIPRDQRNIYEYRSYGELYTLIKPYLILPSEDISAGSKEIKRRERAQALEESEVLYRSKHMIVAVPLTESAAQWWGRGTKWCTAADKNNYFDNYNQKAPLIVITILTNQGAEKFQFWTDTRESQFMNAQDRSVDKETIKKHWSLFKPFIEYMFEQNYKMLDHIPEELQTVEVCTRVVEKNPHALLYVSHGLRNLEMYRLAVEKDGALLENVPVRLRTPEICMLAVKQNGDALRSIPKKHRTAELCRIAVEQSGLAISYVPEELQTTELVWLAIQTNPLAISFFPEKLRTPDMYRFAIEKNGITLGSMLPSLITDELCELAVASNGDALSFVPQRFKTLDICIKAVKKCGNAIICVPNEYRTYELYRLAIEQDPMLTGCIPEKFANSDLYRIAIEKDGMALFNIPFFHQTHELTSIAINQNPKVFNYLYERLKTYEICKLAIEKYPELIEYVPTKHQTPELITLSGNFKSKKLWDQSMLLPLQDQLNQYFEKRNCDEPIQSYPIHH